MKLIRPTRHHRRLASEQLESRHLLCGATVCISEFMADNASTLDDFQGDSSDWLEVYNPTGQTVDLTGWYLTDDAADLTKWYSGGRAAHQFSHEQKR